MRGFTAPAHAQRVLHGHASFGPSQGTEEPTRDNTRVKLFTGGLLACCGWPSLRVQMEG